MNGPRELILERPGRAWHLIRAPRGEVAESLCGRRREGNGWTVGVRDEAAQRDEMCGHCCNVKSGATYRPALELIEGSNT